MPNQKRRTKGLRPFPLVSPDDTYDAKEYQKILLKATEELLIPFGYDVKGLEADRKSFLFRYC